ncbi:MAE_28990/MAE_18760 family HEPN-like nuclease [Psychromonas sp. Urea-02u-13]|uniref:MAE_28990/MAE_18760 family HEPN-like nuclease n=1 Tax=Psychromonas sp. Urea-02u-13 TaxID=2058326 RepID=UPI000C34DAFE|nr:MAE_28990/MAE_18760 family HEPN-like nuclease [Psychromonas sp. Urea-02u-13]PKG37171.1 hypothetical protein CXF74_20275 [Psychromonas sp. Urea-02u-13]
MSSGLQEDLDARQDDLDLIIKLTSFLSKQVNSSIKGSNDVELQINDELLDILKSVIHMMNYNQVESTLTLGMEKLYDDFSDNEVGYSQLKPSIQRKVLSAVHKNDTNIYKAVTNNLDLNVADASLDLTKLFNGNVTLSTFDDIKQSYDIRVNGPRRDELEEDFNTLKKTRNDLSHGNKSYSELGRQNSLKNFLEVSSSVSSYMQHTVTAFDTYINNKKYLVD